MSDEEGLVPVPPKEVPEKIDEAFEVEKPDASITVVINPPPPSLSFQEVEDMMLSVLTFEDLSEEIETRRQTRLTNKEIGKLPTIIVWATVGWLIVAAVCVIAYMVAMCFGITLLPENALVGLIGTAVLVGILAGIAKIIQAAKK